MAEDARFAGPPVCIVGNINRDVKVRNVPDSPKLFEDGETSVPPIIETVGGGGANSACAAAALGGTVRFVAKAGADALADRLKRVLERHGVQTRFSQDPNCATGTTVALGLASGHRHFLSSLPNNETLRFEDLDLAALDGCAHLLRADVWFSESMLEGGNLRLFKEAHRQGCKTSLDLNFDPCWSTGDKKRIAGRKELLRRALTEVDLAHGNERELCEFTDGADLKTALQRLTQWGVKGVVVHLGRQGAGFWADGEFVVEPPSPVRKVVNSTGSGDVLSICMILLHARSDLSVREKLRLSNAVVRQFMEGQLQLIPTI